MDILANYMDLFYYATNRQIQYRLPRNRLSAKETTRRKDSIRTVKFIAMDDALLSALAILSTDLSFFLSSKEETLIRIVFAIPVQPPPIYNGKNEGHDNK